MRQMPKNCRLRKNSMKTYFEKCRLGVLIFFSVIFLLHSTKALMQMSPPLNLLSVLAGNKYTGWLRHASCALCKDFCLAFFSYKHLHKHTHLKEDNFGFCVKFRSFWGFETTNKFQVNLQKDFRKSIYGNINLSGTI